MFINRLARDAVVVASGLLMIAIVRLLGVEVGWLLLCLPSTVLLPVFVIAGMTRSYRNAVGVIRGFQGLSLVALLILFWQSWPYVIPQAIATILGLVAVSARTTDEGRVAGSVAAAATVPLVCALCIVPTHLIAVLLLVLFVGGLLWHRTARFESSIPRAFVVDAA